MHVKAGMTQAINVLVLRCTSRCLAELTAPVNYITLTFCTAKLLCSCLIILQESLLAYSSTIPSIFPFWELLGSIFSQATLYSFNLLKMSHTSPESSFY